MFSEQRTVHLCALMQTVTCVKCCIVAGAGYRGIPNVMNQVKKNKYVGQHMVLILIVIH